MQRGISEVAFALRAKPFVATTEMLVSENASSQTKNGLLRANVSPRTHTNVRDPSSARMRSRFLKTRPSKDTFLHALAAALAVQRRRAP